MARKLNVMPLAKRFAKKVGGSAPKHIGEFRWSESNDSATITTYSPEGVKVVVVVSDFGARSKTLDFFSSESLSELDKFENIGHMSYRRANLREMEKDVEWVWETVDQYKRSWETGDE